MSLAYQRLADRVLDSEGDGGAFELSLDIGDGGTALGQITTESTLEVTVRAENRGDEFGFQSFDVTVDGRTVGTVSFSLGGGQTESDSVRFSPQTTGTKTVAVGGQSTTITVEAPAAPADIEVLPTIDIRVVGSGLGAQLGQITTESTVEATVSATNRGDEFGSASFPVTIDGQQVGTVSFSLGSGASGEDSVRFTPPSAGTFTVAANGATASIEVQKPAGPPAPPTPTLGGVPLVVLLGGAGLFTLLLIVALVA